MKIQLENACAIAIDLQTGLLPTMHKHKKIERNAATFLKGCRILDIPVIVTQQYTKGLGESTDAIKEALGQFDYIDKTSFSCCTANGFMEKLEETGKKDIIIAGIEAHICVLGTALDLKEKGYNVYLLGDCVGSRKDYDRKYAFSRMREAGIVITTTEAALFEMLLDAKHPKRKEISALIK